MGWSAAKWDKYNLEELIAKEAEASAKGQRQKLDEIRWAITNKLAERRAERGDPVPTNGYSGRQSKRRK